MHTVAYFENISIFRIKLTPIVFHGARLQVISVNYIEQLCTLDTVKFSDFN